MKLYPCPFNVGDRREFNNKHGKVILEVVTESRPVRSIRTKDAPEECRITWDEMEQIALITDQVRLQPCCGPLEGRGCAFILHDTTSSAGFVKLVELEYLTSMKACDQVAADLDAGRNRLP